jgi:hypothetical protein
LRPDELTISHDVLARLGDAGARAVAGALHARGGDCQTCVFPLKPGGVSLCVDETDVLSIASLHHTQCRFSGWNATGRVTVACQSVTYAVNNWLVEDTEFGPTPVMVLNPSLEQVVIKEVDGGWHPSPQAQYTGAGLRVRVTAADAMPQADATITARVNTHGIIRLSVPSREVYPAPRDFALPAPQEMLAEARRQASIVLAVAHAADAAAMEDLNEVNKVLADPLTVVGRVALFG